jgi:tRNA C32,U32 (ribose-2'-O)-methylase TrmJ
MISGMDPPTYRWVPWSPLAESAILGGIAQEISDARRAVRDREEAIRMLKLLAATTGQRRDLHRRLRHERREVERLRRAVARLERRWRDDL